MYSVHENVSRCDLYRPICTCVCMVCTYVYLNVPVAYVRRLVSFCSAHINYVFQMHDISLKPSLNL